MPTFRHGKSAVFKVGSNGTPTALVDISNVLNSVTFPRSADLAETTAFGSNARSYIPGFPQNQFSIQGQFDFTVDGQLSALQNYDTPVAVQYRPEGSVTGRVTYDAVGGAGAAGVFLASYNITSGVNDVVNFQADFTNNLAITRGTVP